MAHLPADGRILINMANDRAPASRERGKFLVVLMAVLLIVFLVIAFWGSRRGASPNPSPVRNEQPAK